MNLVKLNMTFVGIVLASAGAFTGGLVFPGLHGLEERREKISLELDQAQMIQSSVANLGQLYEQVVELKNEEDRLWSRMPKQARSGEYLDDLSKCLAAAGVEKYSIQPQPSRDVDPAMLPEELKLAANISVLPVTIKFQADFKTLCTILAELEGLERLIHVNALNTSNDEKRPGQLQIELSLVAYYRRAE
ncbi:MAG TPA: type 4a pilus biogenesis protein PilO [Phycisphaerae bacterium]|nr:type 4a pilus biogenesis protein PilO [Phycisphaerae bacterium]